MQLELVGVRKAVMFNTDDRLVVSDSDQEIATLAVAERDDRLKARVLDFHGTILTVGVSRLFASKPGRPFEKLPSRVALSVLDLVGALL
jgi:hypothetical protein